MGGASSHQNVQAVSIAPTNNNTTSMHYHIIRGNKLTRISIARQTMHNSEDDPKRSLSKWAFRSRLQQDADSVQEVESPPPSMAGADDVERLNNLINDFDFEPEFIL